MVGRNTEKKENREKRYAFITAGHLRERGILRDLKEGQ